MILYAHESVHIVNTTRIQIVRLFMLYVIVAMLVLLMLQVVKSAVNMRTTVITYFCGKSELFIFNAMLINITMPLFVLFFILCSFIFYI